MNTRALIIGLLLLLPAGAVSAAESAPETPVSLELRDVDARSALETLFRSADKQFVLESGVTGRIGSVSFKDTPFELALRQLTRSAGLTYRIADGVYTVTVKQQSVSGEVPRATSDVPPDVLPVVAADTIVEKIKLTHMSAAEILSALGQAQTAAVAAFPTIGGTAQQQFGVPRAGGVNYTNQQHGRMRSYSPATPAVPMAGSFVSSDGRTW